MDKRNIDPELARKRVIVVWQMVWGKPNKVNSLPSNFYHFHRKAPTRKGGRGGEGVDCKVQLAMREKKIFAFLRPVEMFMISLRCVKAPVINTHSVFQTINFLSNRSLFDSDTFNDTTR